MSGSTMILGGLFTWLSGFILNKYVPIAPGTKTVSLSSKVMLLLGNPNKETNRSIISFVNLFYQLFGLFAVLWGIVIYVFRLEPALFTIIGVFLGILMCYLSSEWLYRKNPIRWEGEE